MPKILQLEESAVRLVTTRDLSDRGASKAKIARLVRAGKLVRICPGVYLEPPIDLQYVESKHVLRAAGFSLRTQCEWSLSHCSAALMHGLPALDIPLGKVVATRHSDTPRSGQTSVSIQHRRPLPAEEVVVIAGFKVTRLERTLLDVATTYGFSSAVVAIEAALYRHLVNKNVLVEYFESKRNLANLPAGIRALAFASPASQSALESRSRLFFDHFGIAQPEQQVLITTRSGRTYRVDFLWRALKLIGEADGKSKIVGAGGTTREQEKRLREHWRREEDLRAEGYTVVRWTWDDLAKPDELRLRLESAFAQARRVAA